MSIHWLCLRQTCAKVPKRFGIQGSLSPRSGILMDLGPCVVIFVERLWKPRTPNFFFEKNMYFPITHHPTYAARHITTFLRSHSSGTTFDRRSVQTTPARRNGAAPQTVTEARLTGASNALSTYSRTIPHHSRGRHGLAWTGNKRVVRSHFSTARRVFF